MKDFIRPYDEEERLDALNRLNILTGDSDERFARITRIAQRMFAVPMADFSIIDAQNQKPISCYGLEPDPIPRDVSMANYAILKNDTFMVPDTHADERFSGNPLVVSQPKIRFFAAFPIRSKSGYRIGTLSIADRVPRSLSAHDQSVLRDLAEMIENELAFIEVSMFDRMTQMSINDGFFSLAQQGLHVCEREKTPAVAVVFDVKKMSSTNDSETEFDEDKHIKVFASQLRHFFRRSDVVGRLGSEEFTALLLNAKSEHVDEIVRKLQTSIDIYNSEAGGRTKVSFSHAVAEFDPENPVSSNALVSNANLALSRLARAV
jgi:diguanylate cyclase (GGDEF)-like protein